MGKYREGSPGTLYCDQRFYTVTAAWLKTRDFWDVTSCVYVNSVHTDVSRDCDALIFRVRQC